MKTLIGSGRKIIAAFLVSNAALMCTAPLSADEPRRAFGGLFDASRVSEKRISDEQDVLGRQQRARRSIEKAVSAIKNEYLEFREFVQQGDKAVQGAVREVRKVLPEELQAAAARIFDRPFVRSATGESPAEMPVAEERPAENAVPALQLPQAVKKYERIWEDVCQYHAADIRLHGEVQMLLAKAKEVDNLTAQDADTANRLAMLANELVEGYSRLKGEKWLIDAKRKVRNIDMRARKFKEESLGKIKQAVERHERCLAERRAAEERAKAAEAADAKLKATIEEEQKSAEEEFRNLEESIKRIDWSCTNSLIRAQAKMTTREGKDAMKDQIRKIEVMAGMQRHFIKNAKGVRFTRGKVLLAIVTKVEKDGTLTIQKTKRDKNGRILCDRNSGKPMMDRESRLQWRWIYDLKEEEYLSYMNSLIIELVLRGRENTHIGPREWSDHMLGAALTLRQFYGNQKGVDKFVPELVRKAVKGFEPNRAWAVKWFPDVKLEDSDE